MSESSTESGPLQPSTLLVPISLLTAAYHKDNDLHNIDPEQAKKLKVPQALAVKRTMLSTSSNFNPANSQTCTSNFQIDKAIKLKTPPDSMVMVNANWKQMTGDYTFKVKPIVAYMNYIGSLTVPGTMEKTLEKKNGYSSRFEVSAQVKASASAGIFGCNASLEVTTGFSYSETISSETTETWKETLTSGSYVVYQNCLLYAYKFEMPTDPIQLIVAKTVMAVYASQGVKWYNKNESAYYFFVPVFRNDPFTLKYSDALYDPVPYDDIISYVTNDGWNRW